MTGLQSHRHGIMRKSCQNVVEAHLLLLSMQEGQRCYISGQTILTNEKDFLRSLRYMFFDILEYQSTRFHI